MTEKKTNKRRRVLVTVSPEMYDLIHAVSDEASVATSNLLGQLIEDARPAFEAMLLAVRQAKESNADAYDTLHRLLIATQNLSNDMQVELLDEQKKLRRAPAER